MTTFARALVFAAALLVASGPTYAQDVAKAEIDAFVARVKSCWNLTPEEAESGKSVKIRVSLNVDGTLATTEIVDADTSTLGQRLAAGAVRAMQRCAPYSFSVESYEVWKTIEVDLRT